MYSEHLIAHLLRHCETRYRTGATVDAVARRAVVTVGSITGPLLGYGATDGHLAWMATATGTEVAVGTRGAVHLMADGRCAVGLGPTRGVIESAGDRLVHVTTLDPARYVSAWRLPTLYYGGLI